MRVESLRRAPETEPAGLASLLYVPANVERFIEKAHTRGADCIQLDLEDSVPASEKDAARRAVPGAAARVRRGGADVVVRINSGAEIERPRSRRVGLRRCRWHCCHQGAGRRPHQAHR